MIGLWVGIGGALGAVMRFAIGGWVTTWAYAGFPWGTFTVNVIGSLVLGFLYVALPSPSVPPATRAFVGIGLCGGFTTFSTFDFEMFALLQQADYTTAALYSSGSVAACTAGVFGGMLLARRINRRSSDEVRGG